MPTVCSHTRVTEKRIEEGARDKKEWVYIFVRVCTQKRETGRKSTIPKKRQLKKRKKERDRDIERKKEREGGVSRRR